ncbi:MAG TPA: aminoglycoside phosphotransferase family protein [Devosia sp.]|nr:aminoglycoside phosphotransferase family protein [Devosia sp.]
MREEKLRAGKFDVDVPLVERLVAAQFPQWAGLPVRAVARDGWDNWTFRLGERLKARFPSAADYAEQADKEARWLPRLAPHLPAPVPVPVGVGRPGEGFPWSWSVYEWLEGEPATRAGVADAVQFGWDVARFITALQGIDTTGGPPPGQHSYFRGGDVMTVYGAQARRSVEAIAEGIDAEGARAVLDAAAAAPFAGPPVWVHGDLAIGNLLVREGRLAAVIDFGCLAVGDPACDLVLAWTFLEGAGREAFRLGVPADAAMWARARGWALWKAALLIASDMTINPDETPPPEVIAAVIADHRREIGAGR